VERTLDRMKWSAERELVAEEVRLMKVRPGQEAKAAEPPAPPPPAAPAPEPEAAAPRRRRRRRRRGRSGASP
jgi:hypothetical protein